MAVFAPCTTGTVALYTDERDDERLLAIPVEAWDEQGRAYVADVNGLIEAATVQGFVRLEQASQPLPAPGRPVREPVRIGPPEGRPPGPRDPTDPRGPRPATERGR